MTFNFPINSTSLGSSAFHILRNTEDNYKLIPIGGQIDISSFDPCPDDFKIRLQKACEDGMEEHSIEDTSIKLWHPFASMERISKKQILYTFHELDGHTKLEKNALNQQEAVIVPCQFNKEVMERHGVTSPVHVVPLGVDRSVFYPLEKHKTKTGPYIFVIAGKFEARKLHMEILTAFAATFANNPNVKLRCCISNRFIDMKQVMPMIQQRVFKGQVPSNIEFIDWLPTEKHFADFLSHADCLISPSRGESCNLPLLQAMSCGVNVITNADHAHKDYVTEANAIVIPSEGQSVAQDNTFFRNDGKTNTGTWFNISANSIAAGMIRAVTQGRGVNNSGIETAKQYSWKNTANGIKNIWHSLKT